MAQYGLLIDNEYCTGCRSCEVACKNENDLLSYLDNKIIIS